ncbi:MAG: cyclic nucleotide-binding domain-containing protein [Acidimicrobiales bacterium]|nr:cyclic nucleotide-binding domain-containing protein [Acidimicrobiales bacterium]
MKLEACVVAVSWIPSEAVKGAMRAPFELGIAHYDEPLPDVLGDLDDWKARDLFRVANVLRAWIEVDESGAIVGHGYLGGGVIGATTMGLGSATATFRAVPYPDLQAEPDVGDGWVRFTQTAGGRTGVPAPRRVAKPPFVQYHAPTAWSTLALTIKADGTHDWDLVGASPFPRHWIYGPDGKLAAKSGLVDFKDWYHHAFGESSPWGGEESPALVTAVESAMERQLSRVIMGEGKPKIRKLKAGAALTQQGEEADAIYLLLDGVIQVQVDGEEIAALGPGALIGERAVLEGGRRTATLVAVSPCKVAEARKVELDLAALAEVSAGHRREEQDLP